MRLHSTQITRWYKIFAGVSAAVLLVACSERSDALQTALGVAVELVAVTENLDNPVVVAHAGDGTDRLFIAEQRGQIRIVADGALIEKPFLDLRAKVSCCGERGLLGLAFHPLFEENRQFFVYYTNRSGDVVVARYQGSKTDADAADPASETTLLTIGQPYANHNGGQIAFGPDGYLYIGTGDGGSGGDPQNHSQDLTSLLGKILRIDVDRTEGQRSYAVPADNPFSAPARREIWAYGLRNPWRFSFDRTTGDLWIGDVGQYRWEEIDLQPATSAGGENYGWRKMEGAHCFQPRSGCRDDSLVEPVLEYDHGSGRCAVIGGYRYRGTEILELQGRYLYGDYCGGTVWSATPDASGDGWKSEPLLDTGVLILSFGEDEAGELYIAASRPGGQGVLYKIAPTDTELGEQTEKTE